MRRYSFEFFNLGVSKNGQAKPLFHSRRWLHFPLSPPPIPIEYLDTDPLEYAIQCEGREWGFDDFRYMRELAFVRIHDNPTVGDFRKMNAEDRKALFWGSDRQDFFRHLTMKLCGKPEHLYHRDA